MTLDWRVFGAIPVALLCTSAALDFAYFPMLGAAAAAMILGLVAASVQVRRPVVGLSLFLISAVALPIHFGPNDEMTLAVVLAAAVCACWAAAALLSRQRGRISLLSPVGVGGLLMVSCVASAAAGQIPSLPASLAPARAQAAEIMIFAISIGLLVSVALGLKSASEVKYLTRLFLLVGAVTLFLLQPPFDPIARHTIVPTTVGSAFFSWLVAVSAGQALFNFQLKMLPRLACAVLAIGCLADTFINRFTWVSGWFPALLALGLLMALRFPRTAAVGTLVAAPLVGYSLMAGLDRVLDNESYSIMTRIAAWDTLWQVISASPVLGSGPANYYHFTELFSTLGWYVSLSSHQQYIDIAAQLGFVGLGVFAVFAIVVVRFLWRMQGDAQSGFERAFALSVFVGAIASLASGMLADWILPFVYNVGLKGMRSSLLFWLFLGLSLALQRGSESPRVETESAPDIAIDLDRYPMGRATPLTARSSDFSTAGRNA